MSINYKRVGTAVAALVASSMLLVPALQTNADSLPDPDTVPCEAFGSDDDCLSRPARRTVERPCGVPVTSTAVGSADTTKDELLGSVSVGEGASEDDDLALVDLIAHTNRL
jgi:hypothetical protein